MKKMRLTKKKLKMIAFFLCVCLVTGLTLNEAGLLQLTRAEVTVMWDVPIPTTPTALTYAYSGGTGRSASTAWQIKSADDLSKFICNVNSGLYSGGGYYFQLMSDFNLNGNVKDWTPIGERRNPFTGCFFNGNNHTVSNMKITMDKSKNEYLGFFGAVNGGEISKLNVGGEFEQKDTVGNNVGGLVGYATNNAKITECSFSGTVKGVTNVGGLVGWYDGSSKSTVVINNCRVQSGSTVSAQSRSVGGLVGRLNAGCIINSFNRADVTLSSGGSNESVAVAGGISGYIENGAVVNCYNMGSVSSSNIAGGIGNGTTLTIQNCYNTGQVSGASTDKAGGISGSIDSNSIFNRCFYKNDSCASGAIPSGYSTLSAYDIGVFSDATYEAKLSQETTGMSSSWAIADGTNLLNALSGGAGLFSQTYAEIYDWQIDQSGNNPYAIHDTSAAAHVHDQNGDTVITKQPTCVEKGHAYKTCSKCTNKVTITYEYDIDPLKHTYQRVGHENEPWVFNPGQPQTCTTTGYAVKICGDCGNRTPEQAFGPTGHDLKTVSYAATCTTEAYEETSCSHTNCIEYATPHRVKLGEKLGHDYSMQRQGATCYLPETLTYTCSRCQDTYQVTSGSALGHSWNNEKGVSVDSSCIKQGGMLRTCIRCNFSEFVGEKFPYAAHDFQLVTTAATCLTRGIVERVCQASGCSVVEEVEGTYVAPLGHSINPALDVVTDPTCTTKGFTTHYCDRDGCGYSYTDTETGTRDHAFLLNKEESVEPTCTKNGKYVYECKDCHTKKETLRPNLGGHKYTTSEALSVPQTCETGGYDVLVCDVCGDEKTVNVTTEGSGHDYQEETIAPTCLDAGQTIKKCRKCGRSEIVAGSAVPALGHDYNKVETKATTTSYGYTTYTCKRCGDEYESDFIAATPNASYNVLTQILTLSDVDEWMSFSLDGGEKWTAVQATCAAVTAEAVNTDVGIWVKRLGSNPEIALQADIRQFADSEIQKIEVKKAALPDDIAAFNPTVVGNDGKITGLSTDMEYRMEGEEVWHDVVSDVMENLSPGTYYFRMKATENFFASDAKAVVIEEYVEPTENPGSTDNPGNPDNPNPGSTDNPGNPDNPNPGSTDNPGNPGNPSNTDNPNRPDNPGKTNEPEHTNGPVRTNPPRGTTVPTNRPINSDGSNGDLNNGGSNNVGGNDNGGNNVGGNNNGGNNAGGNDNAGGNATEQPNGVIPNTVYYSGGARTSSTGSGTSRVAAKTSDDASIAVWAVLACLACAGSFLAFRKKEEE